MEGSRFILVRQVSFPVQQCLGPYEQAEMDENSPFILTVCIFFLIRCAFYSQRQILIDICCLTILSHSNCVQHALIQPEKLCVADTWVVWQYGFK